MEFPRFVYKDKGQHQRVGGTYSYMRVLSDADLKLSLSNGWFLTLPEAIECKPVETVDEEDKIIIEDNKSAIPTRAEMIQKAEELGIKIDLRMTDKKIFKVIDKFINGVN